MGLTYQEIVARIGRPEDTVQVSFGNGDAARELGEAQADLADAEMRFEVVDPLDTALRATRSKAVSKARERLKRARKQAVDESYAHRLQGLPKVTFEELVRQHAPSDKQKKEWTEAGMRGEPAFDTDTFPPALVAACSIDPPLTEENTKEMWLAEDSVWPAAVLKALFNVAHRLSTSDGIVNLGKDSAGT